ncbi:MAG: hypothetical protein ONB12_00155 [candidate division KSB1 bacterium]|nr:hypothetical protein [candidate division KSB1 bacterium]
MSFKYVAFIILFSLADLSADEVSLWDSARRLYYSALQSEEKHREAVDLFQKLAQSGEKQGVAQTYLGSLIAVKAKYVFSPHAKLRWAKQGLAVMDEGLAKAEHDLEALFIHGTTCYYLPFFFNRREAARQSFRKIIALGPQATIDTPPELVRNALNFILKVEELDPIEREGVQKWLNELERTGYAQ